MLRSSTSLSTTRRCARTQFSHARQVGSDASVAELPNTMSPRRARVIATFSRRASARNPTEPAGFARTALNRITSFSRPWRAWREVSRSPTGLNGVRTRSAKQDPVLLAALHDTIQYVMSGPTDLVRMYEHCAKHLTFFRHPCITPQT